MGRRAALAGVAVLAGAALLALAQGLRGDGGREGDGEAVPSIHDPRVGNLGTGAASALAPARCTSGSFRTVGSSTTAVAVVVVRPTVARRGPGGAEIMRLGLENVNGVPTVLGVRGERLRSDCRPSWYRVQLPIRPNGSTGWVRAADVSRYTLDIRVVVDLSDRLVTAYRGSERLLQAKAAIGKPETPTPTGRYYVNQRLLAGDPTGPWGPGGVGISAFSPVLVDWAQGGPIAIHGTNQPYLIGDAVSNGCVRISNYQLRRLMELAVEGTPVVIRA